MLNIASSGSATPSVDLDPPGEVPRPRDVQVPGHHKYAGPFSWPPRFFECRRRILSRDWENSPFIESWLKKGARELGENDISIFLRTEENWAPDRYRVQCVLDVTCEATIQRLIERDANAQKEKIALLIDGNCIGPQPDLREFIGGLTAQALYDELSKSRYGENDDASIVDADRRLIYVDNLDAWGIMALVGTSSESLFRVLGEFILNYICPNPSIGVSFSTVGPETFAMQFSFPFRVWRSTPQLMNDTRRSTATGSTLRSSRDVTFLRHLAGHKENSAITDGIYATNISCIVTGSDQSRWTGLVLLETWFDEVLDDPSPDMVTRYENDFSDGLLLDPLCRGKEDAIKSKWSPRPYFIHVLAVRIVQMHMEWASLYTHLTERMKAPIKRYKELIRRVRTPTLHQAPPIPTQRKVLEEFDEIENSFRCLGEIWVEIAQDLQETVRAGELFMKTDVLYFRNYDEPSDDASICLPYLTQVRKTFTVMEQLRQRLEDMQKQCKEMVEEVASARKMHRQQSDIARPVHHSARVLAWTTILTLPLIITTALFNCGDIFTFKLSLKSFVIVLLVVTVVMFAILAILLRLATGLWLLQSQKVPRDEVEGEYNLPSTLSSQQNPAADQRARVVPRRATFFTSVIDVFQSRVVKRAVAENLQLRDQMTPGNPEPSGSVLPPWGLVQGQSDVTATESRNTPRGEGPIPLKLLPSLPPVSVPKSQQ